MGTPAFAVGSLRALLDDGGYTVAGVFTQPDKPVGRRAVLTPPPVKVLAEQRGVPVFQPAKLRDEAALATLRGLAPDCIVVVAYGKLLPPALLEIPPLGCINVHASLLPRYRGAGPIAAAILHGETETGVTTMHMAEGLDTGDMIYQASTPIGPEETTPELHDRLAALGARLLLQTLPRLADGTAPRIAQDGALACHAPMLTKEAAAVDFTADSAAVHNLVRAMAGWPVAHCVWPDGGTLKLHAVRLAEGAGTPGEVLDERCLIVACGQGAVRLCEVQYEGGRRMPAADFLRGHPIARGDRLLSGRGAEAAT